MQPTGNFHTKATHLVFFTVFCGAGNNERDLQGLHELLYSSASDHPGGDGVCYVVVCRVCLGYSIRTQGEGCTVYSLYSALVLFHLKLSSRYRFQQVDPVELISARQWTERLRLPKMKCS